MISSVGWHYQLIGGVTAAESEKDVSGECTEGEPTSTPVVGNELEPGSWVFSVGVSYLGGNRLPLE